MPLVPKPAAACTQNIVTTIATAIVSEPDQGGLSPGRATIGTSRKRARNRMTSTGLPEALRSFLTITEVDDAEPLVGELFRRKFAAAPPDVPRHLVALYRDPSGGHRIAGYSHMRPFGDVYLSGGSCSDGSVVATMAPEHREALYAAGGTWYLILRYAFAKFAPDCEAFFGHCGDRRALEVAQAAGFERTEHEHLIVHWHKPLHPIVRRALVAKAHAIGPF